MGRVLRVQIGDSLILGVTDPTTGVRWGLRDFQGWGSTASSVTVMQRTRAQGAWSGEAFAGARHMSAVGSITAPTAAALEAATDRLVAAVSLGETRVTVQEPTRERWVMATREDLVDPRMITDRFATYSIQLVAPDSRRFGSTLTASTGLPSTSGGLLLPLRLPLTLGSTVISGEVSLTSSGNALGPVTLRIDGPVTGPVVTHQGTGVRLMFASGMTLGAGEFLTVDMERQEVLAQGQSTRNEWVTQRGWSGFLPGPNTWSFAAAAGSGSLTVTAVEAWQ